MDFSIDAFNRTYSAEPLHFKEATSPHFKCKYTYREDGAVFQFEPTIIPIRKDFITNSILNKSPETVGIYRLIMKSFTTVVLLQVVVVLEQLVYQPEELMEVFLENILMVLKFNHIH